VEDGWEYRAQMFEGIRARTLVLVGTETPPALIRATLRAAAAIPAARLRVLDGHGHLAILEDPAMVAGLVVGFVRE
jgi:pimeloyl-ACP methyl ester carboxylesterase